MSSRRQEPDGQRRRIPKRRPRQPESWLPKLPPLSRFHAVRVSPSNRPLGLRFLYLLECWNLFTAGDETGQVVFKGIQRREPRLLTKRTGSVRVFLRLEP